MAWEEDAVALPVTFAVAFPARLWALVLRLLLLIRNRFAIALHRWRSSEQLRNQSWTLQPT